MLEKMDRVAQIHAVFKSQSGREFVKDMVKESFNMAPEMKALVLDLLSKPFHPLRTNLVSVSDVKSIVIGISDDIEPELFPIETIKSYRNSAKIGSMNFKLEEKCLAALGKLEKDNFNGINYVLEGAYLIPRVFSVNIVKQALAMVRDMNLEILDEVELVKLWINLGFVRHYYNIEDRTYVHVTEKLLGWKYENMKYLHLITDYLKKTASNDRRIIEFLYDKVLENLDNLEFFGGDSIDDTLINLHNLHINNCDIYMTEKIASDIMNLMIRLNEAKRVGDSELAPLILILNKFTKLTTETENYLKNKLISEENFIYIKICTCLLLYRNLPELKQDTELICTAVLNNANFSLATFSIIYLLLDHLPNECKVNSVKSLIELIEKMFDSSVNDAAGYKMFWKIFEKSKNDLINSNLWDNYQKKVSLIMKNSMENYNFPLTRKTEILVSIYNPYLNSYKEWLESSKTILTKCSGSDIYDCIFDKFEISDTAGYLDLALQSKTIEAPSISHFLSLNVYNPSHRVLHKATKLLKGGNFHFLIDKKFKISKNSLLTKIFKTGYYSLIEDFNKNAKFRNLVKEINLNNIKPLVTLLGQYTDFNADLIKNLRIIKTNDEVDDVDEIHFFIALLTAKPDLELEKYLLRFIEFDENTSLDHLIEKVNLYLNLHNEYPGFDEFQESIIREILRRAEKDPMILVGCFEALTTVAKKKNELNEFNKLLQMKFSEANLTLIDKNNLARALCCFLDKNADLQLINTLENHLGGYELTNSLIERIIYSYKKNKIVTNYYEKVMSSALNQFGEQLIKEIAEL